MLNQRALRVVRKLFILLVMTVPLVVTSTNSMGYDYPVDPESCREECNYWYDQCLWYYCGWASCSNGTRLMCYQQLIACHQSCGT